MSIATKTGDNGTTGLLFGSRVSKADKRIAAVGDVDELCAAIGLVKSELAQYKPAWNKTGEHSLKYSYLDLLTKIQKALTLFMGEVVTEASKRESYVEKFDSLKEEDLALIDDNIVALEKNPNTKQTDWVVYGATELGARCDFASKVCRRAERSFSEVVEQEQLNNPENKLRILLSRYINRLSDLLHLLARFFDSLSEPVAAVKKIYRYE
jgi:cob(I)alamin adenosyltransferase